MLDSPTNRSRDRDARPRAASSDQLRHLDFVGSKPPPSQPLAHRSSGSPRAACCAVEVLVHGERDARLTSGRALHALAARQGLASCVVLEARSRGAPLAGPRRWRRARPSAGRASRTRPAPRPSSWRCTERSRWRAPVRRRLRSRGRLLRRRRGRCRRLRDRGLRLRRAFAGHGQQAHESGYSDQGSSISGLISMRVARARSARTTQSAASYSSWRRHQR